MPDWSIVIHGGAKTIEPHEEAEHCAAALEAVINGAAILKTGGTALAAVEAAIKAMEKGGVFNAGAGSVGRSDGSVQLDASIMDGQTLDIGAVAGLVDAKHPICVAMALLRERTIFLAGNHANEFARKKGFDFAQRDPKVTHASVGCDTVGCVALDRNGNYAVGLSTGGLTNALPGRVGDVPLPGCGFYADNNRGALCLSGDGEFIARLVLASEILHGLEKTTPESAISGALEKVKELGGEAGCILLDRNGHIFWDHNSENFSIACQTSDDKSPAVYLSKTESGDQQ